MDCIISLIVGIILLRISMKVAEFNFEGILVNDKYIWNAELNALWYVEFICSIYKIYAY